MRKVLIALFATAAAALPASVSAQDDGGGRRPRAFERSDDAGGPARERVRREAAEPGSTDGGRRFERAERSAPAPNVQVEAQARVERNRDGNGGGRSGGWDRQRPDRAPVAQAPAQVQPQPVPVEARRDRARGDGGFAGSVFGRDVDRGQDVRRDDARTRDRDNARNDGRDWNRDNRRDDNRWNDGRRNDGRRNDGRWNDGRRDDNRWNDGRRNDGRDWNGNRGNTRNWDRTWRNDRRYDWQRYRSSNRNVFRLPRYNAPYSWHYGYRRQSIGAYLFSSLFAQNYWISDPWDYRLPPVEWPYRWVRYYDDALLVDTQTGRVVDAIEGIFWY